MINYVNILGINFSKLNLRETVNLIDTKISQDSNKLFHLITVNPEIAVQIQDDPELKKISLCADLITPDGVGIVWASRLKRNPVPKRVTGYDLLLETLKVGNQKGWSFYLLGSDEEVNSNASEYILKNHPNVKIAGKVKRTPEIFKKLNLEWLHRRITQPSRKESQKKLKVFAYRTLVETVHKNTN